MGPDMEVICSQFEVIGPVVGMGSVLVKLGGPVVEATAVLSLEEARGSACEVSDALVHVGL